MRIPHRLAAVLTITVAASFLAAPVHAQVANALGLDTLVQSFTAAANGWGATLMPIAQGLFGSLVIIEMSIVFGYAFTNGIEFGALLGLIARQAISVGFFYWLLINGPQFLLAVIQSFWQAGGMAGGQTTVSPSSLVTAGIAVGDMLLQGLTWSNPPLDIVLILVWLGILFCFAMMAGILIEALVEAVVVANGCVLILGLGGMGYTRGYSIGMYRWAFSVGVKLMVLELLVSVAQQFMLTFSQQAIAGGVSGVTMTAAGIMLVFPIVLLYLVKRLPSTAQGLVAGEHINSYASLASTMRQAAATMATAGAAMASGGSAIAAAGRLASAQTAASAAQGSGGGGAMGAISQAALITGRTAGNLAKAASNDMAGRATGASLGSFGGRMAAKMNNEAQQVRSAGQAPTPPPAAE